MTHFLALSQNLQYLTKNLLSASRFLSGFAYKSSMKSKSTPSKNKGNKLGNA